MHTVTPRCKRWLFIGTVYVLAMSLLGPVAEAAFRLERADGSRPLNGIHITGMVTAAREPLGAPLGSFLPKRTYKAASASQPVPMSPQGSVWDRLAQCESGGNWHSTGGSFSGGLQFLPSTWRAAGGTRYAPTAAQATREQQIAVAQSWLAKTSWSQWPACSRRLGLR